MRGAFSDGLVEQEHLAVPRVDEPLAVARLWAPLPPDLDPSSPVSV
jgi:hypothetical protein